jgi:hypothetical protein
MEQIVIQVQSKEKARLLSELLQSLDFVNLVTTTQQNNGTKDKDVEADFFALAGIWEDRQIDLASIRQQAWPRQSS